MYLFIHRKDLRTRDLRAFDALKKRDMPGIHLLILDHKLLENGRALAHSGRQFLREAVRLQQEYKQAGHRLHLLSGDPAEVVDAPCTLCQFKASWPMRIILPTRCSAMNHSRSSGPPGRTLGTDR